MKRLVPLILALLLLTACAAETPPEVSAPTPEPTPTVEPTPTPVPTSAPASLPDAGFEPESFWLAEPFGDGGKALLLMAADGRFKCWYSSWHEHPEIDWINLTGGSFTEAEAEAAAEDEALTLEYAESWDSPRPERFAAATYEEALAAFLDMPYNDEVVLPVPERVSRADWEATPGVTPLGADERYRRYEYLGAVVTYEYWDDTLILGGFTAETSDFPFAVRGLGIGSSLDEVFSRFPEGSSRPVERPGALSLYLRRRHRPCRLLGRIRHKPRRARCLGQRRLDDNALHLRRGRQGLQDRILGLRGLRPKRPGRSCARQRS